MEFGGTILNKRLNRNNDGGTTRRTSDNFQLATAILFQNPVQMFGITPNNLYDAPSEAMDFMRSVPTTWDETRYLDGYPGKYVILARRHGNDWYVAGINNTGAPLKVELDLSFFDTPSAKLYYDLGNYMGNNYQACIITAQNALNDYPYTKLREDLSMLILRARFSMAKESVLEKMIDRYRDTVDEYYAFMNEFPESKYAKEAEKIYRDAQKALKK
jgi:hypothetical protein